MDKIRSLLKLYSSDRFNKHYWIWVAWYGGKEYSSLAIGQKFNDWESAKESLDQFVDVLVQSLEVSND